MFRMPSSLNSSGNKGFSPFSFKEREVLFPMQTYFIVGAIVKLNWSNKDLAADGENNVTTSIAYSLIKLAI